MSARIKLYSVEIQICATVYVKADSPQEARLKVAQFSDDTFEFDGEHISRRRFDDPLLPEISLSPAMTACGLWSGAEPQEVA